MAWTFDRPGDCAQTFVITLRLDAIMTTANFKHVVQDLLRRVMLTLQSLGAERRCAVRLDRVADRLHFMGGRINLLRERMGGGGLDEPIDEDRALRDSLKELKEDIRAIRCQLFGMEQPGVSARLQRTFARLSRVAEETYASADKLQWEIDEHDGKFAG